MQCHAQPGKVSGVDFVRVIQPISHLQGFTTGDYTFEVDVWDIAEKRHLAWDEVGEKYDIIYFNYISSPESYAVMACLTREKYGRKLVCDVDDGLWHILPDNPAYEVFKRGSQQINIISRVLDDVDKVTTTNSYLRNMIVNETYKKHENVVVFPNYIDLELYSHRPQFKDDRQIQIAHFGSTTHFSSLQDEEFAKGMDRIMREYPNVSFLSMGCHIPKYKMRWGARYIQGFGDADVMTWIKDKFPPFIEGVDIIVAPLSNNLYNRCKSSIKYLEASSAKKPFVGQNIRQYQEVIKNGENGFLCDTAENWYTSLKKLIDDKALRKSIGEQAFETVKRDWTIQAHRKDYADFFISLLEKK